jgi:hypothetical protein
MIDSNGNISPEYTISLNNFNTEIKTYLRGGYSIGCEITKFDLSNLNYQYK